MERPSSVGQGMKRQLSRAASSIREGLGDYLGIGEGPESQESYYLPKPSDEPYWMKDNFWGTQQQQQQGGEDPTPNAPPMDGVTVIPNNGYDEPPPPYTDIPPSYSAHFSSIPADLQGAEMNNMSSSYYPDGAQVQQVSNNGQKFQGRGRGRGRGGGRGRGRGRGAGGAAGRPIKKVQPPVTYKPYFIITISIVDVILIVWEIITNGGFEPWSVNPWFGPSSSVLLDAGGKYAPLMLAGEWWRFFTPIVLHVGLGHILMNMLTQLRVGLSLERSYGTHRIFPIYLLCGVMGNLASALFLPQQLQVGASGSLFGFTGVLLADLLQNWSLIESPIKNLLSLIFSSCVSLVLGLILPGVDNFAHIGGLIMGVLTGFIFLPSLNPAKTSKQGRLKTVIISTILAVGIFVALFIAFYRRFDANEWCTPCRYITCLKALSWCSA